MKNKIKDVQRFYDQETDRYLLERYQGESCEHLSYLLRKRIVLEYLQDAKGSVLDAGCGPAIFTRELVDMGLKPYSVDVSHEMLKKAKRVASLDSTAFWLNCQVEQLPFSDESFDNVLSIGVIGYVADTMNAINEMARVMKTGGIFVVQCSNLLAPTPKMHNVKDNVLYALHLRRRKWQFDLIRHSFRFFRELLETGGLRVEEKRSYDFRLPFVEKLSARTAVLTMKGLQERFEKSKRFGWLGEGYVVKARKI